VKRRKITISLFAESEAVNFYTVGFQNEESETQKFFDKYQRDSVLKSEFDTISTRIEFIGFFGAEDRHFRYAGKIDDNAMELPNKDEPCLLRLYCLRISTNVVILGNGGIKERHIRTYQDDDWLNSCVDLLLTIDDLIRDRMKYERVKLTGKLLTGDLVFYI
jgi:hypothetical protein